jgi:hypothetical protein
VSAPTPACEGGEAHTALPFRMPSHSGAIMMALSRWSLAIGVGLALTWGSARADERSEANRREAKELLATVRDAGFYALRDPKEKDAIAKLQKLGPDAAPAVAGMLAEGLKARKNGWIQVYRPLYILKGLGKDAAPALPDVIKALDDEHPINVNAAAQVLAGIGPAGKGALAKLEHLWAARSGDAEDVVLGRAIQAIDPKTAERLGIK